MSKIGLWSDCHNFPSLPLMKLSAYHKSIGDTVELFNRWNAYDLVYASKVFSFTEDVDAYLVQAGEIRKGGTGYCISLQNGKEVFNVTKNASLPKEIEHIYPDYTLYPQYKYAVGFLTRGCPRNCGFCVVSRKEGLCSKQVADLSEFWRGQKELKLLDPNILACREHEQLLGQLASSGAKVDFTQGLDIRLTNPDNIQLLNAIKTPMTKEILIPECMLKEVCQNVNQLQCADSQRIELRYADKELSSDKWKTYGKRGEAIEKTTSAMDVRTGAEMVLLSV